jgi:hypothetical protein
VREGALVIRRARGRGLVVVAAAGCRAGGQRMAGTALYGGTAVYGGCLQLGASMGRADVSAALVCQKTAMRRANGVGFISRDGLLGSRSTTVRIALGQAGRPGFSQSSGQEQLREGYLRQHPHTPAPTHLKRPFAGAGLLLVHSCVPEQRQPEAAGSTCWCFWEPPAP